MDFPDYVPQAAREWLTHYIHGERDIPGYEHLFKRAEGELVRLEQAIEVKIGRNEIEYLDSLRQQKKDALEHRDALAKDLSCLHRFASDLNMRDAFNILTKEFSDDVKLRGFMHSAWSANMNYAPVRDRRKKGNLLSDEIAECSSKLAELLREFSNIGISGPDEFYSIPYLLRETDNHDMQGHNLDMWRALRHYVFGDLPVHDKLKRDANLKDPSKIEIVFIKPGEKVEVDPDQVEIDPNQKVRETLRYVWGLAPDLSELLDTVTNGARNYIPNQTGWIEAAISKRQHSEKTAYIRAFASLLGDVHHITPTPALMRAMAIVGTVALDLNGEGISYDDVRKALTN